MANESCCWTTFSPPARPPARAPGCCGRPGRVKFVSGQLPADSKYYGHHSQMNGPVNPNTGANAGGAQPPSGIPPSLAQPQPQTTSGGAKPGNSKPVPM